MGALNRRVAEQGAAPKKHGLQEASSFARLLRFDQVSGVCHAAGLTLTVQPSFAL